MSDLVLGDNMYRSLASYTSLCVGGDTSCLWLRSSVDVGPLTGSVDHVLADGIFAFCRAQFEMNVNDPVAPEPVVVDASPEQSEASLDGLSDESSSDSLDDVDVDEDVNDYEGAGT